MKILIIGLVIFWTILTVGNSNQPPVSKNIIVDKAVSSDSGERLAGHIYEMGSNRKKLFFQLYTNLKKKSLGGVLQSSVYKKSTGEIAVVQAVEYDKDGQFLSFSIEQKQTGDRGKIEVKGSELFFHYQKKNEKNKVSKEKKTDNFVVGPTMVEYLQGKWAQILSGEIVKVRFGVADRRETVGFKYKKMEEKKMNGEDVVVVKMSPSSWIIAQLVDPLYLTFAKESKKFLYQKGRVVPKLKKAGNWKSLDAETYYN